jgi:hypothetical protein
MMKQKEGKKENGEGDSKPFADVTVWCGTSTAHSTE